MTSDYVIVLERFFAPTPRTLTGKGIAGSTIEIEVKGAAKLHATNSLVELVQGRMIIGNPVKEFDVKPNGKGKVEVMVKVKAPQPDAKAVETKYEFEVK